jgi:hypothetical protein
MMWPFNRRNARAGKSPAPTAPPKSIARHVATVPGSVSVLEVLEHLQSGRPLAEHPSMAGGDEGSAYAPPTPAPADDVELRESVEGAERQFEGLVSRWEQVDSAFKTAAVRLAQMMERIEGIHEQLTKAGLPVMVSPNFADDAQKAFGDQLTLVHAEYLALRREVLGLAMAIAPSAESY